jgi:hypothetical protein
MKKMINQYKIFVVCCTGVLLLATSCKTVVSSPASKIEVPATAYQFQIWVADLGNNTYKIQSSMPAIQIPM